MPSRHVTLEFGAPEFHFINHRWYLYYTAMAIPGADATHRIYVLESSGQNPLGPYVYKGRLADAANDRYAIDPTVFQKPDGSLYFVWCADPGHVLYIARMANPWTLQGNGVYLPTSGFGCGRGAGDQKCYSTKENYFWFTRRATPRHPTTNWEEC